MKGRRTHEHGHAGSRHHDEHIGGMGKTHLAAAVDHLRGPESKGAYDGLNHQAGREGQKLAVGGGKAKVEVE